MENKRHEEPGILFPDDDKLHVVSLDDPSGETGNGNYNMPSKLDGEPVSRQVIHAPQTHIVHPPKPIRFPSSDRVLLVMTVVAVIVAFIALLIGGLGLSRRGDIFVNVSSGTGPLTSPTPVSGDSALNDERVWLFAISDYNVRLEYLDLASGEVRGYNVDIINAVCRIANKQCSLVWDVYGRCWETVAGESPRPGIGLQGGWYDACTAWPQTYARSRTFKFTVDMSKQDLAVFMIASRGDLGSFNWRDLTGKTIGFLQSYTEDATCITRFPEITGRNLSRNQVKYYVNEQDLLTAVSNGEVDAVFVKEFLGITKYLQLASDKLNRCTIGGQAMMTRKDSTLADWWNPAFQTLLDSPEYLQICQGLEDENVHGSQPGPTLSEHCIGF
ncbi:uncharacterized protein LOC110983520 [Acanthaster planci]|uniref:Uncharacterized protein LOC110983520 n=1 Tax=Acanthaster planci TaxID=133434 RepID=A0A8B7Z168_ACAPL|nr:uncharacterized protein LOC110983520 [Acanthaster planci]